jgi:hypothetical protein
MWELSDEMVPYVEPTIQLWAENLGTGWLAARWADQRWDGTSQTIYLSLVHEAESMHPEDLVREVAESAIEYGSTTNGGHEVYLDDYASIPFCSEEYMHNYYN